MRLIKSSVPLFAILIASSNLSAHTLTTATGVPVDHAHYTVCGAGGCPSVDSTVEAQFGFRSADRVYSGTGEWNCHGRTFDARRSWVNYVEPWLNNDGPVYTSYPITGDSVIWWGTDGLTSHSVTIVGSINGTSTLVMSKYGKQGQYRHALYNPIAVYGDDWSYVYFNQGTVIYSGLQAANTKIQKGPKVNRTDTEAERNEIRKTMPWYEDVLSSQVIYAVEHPRLVAQSANLNEASRTGLGEVRGDQARLAILISDIADPKHFEILGVYNSPALSEDFISEIEAGKLLAKIVKKRPELKEEIVGLLLKVVTETKGDFKDQLRGAGIHFLTQILNQNERVATKRELRRLFPEQHSEVPTYTDHYLKKM